MYILSAPFLIFLSFKLVIPLNPAYNNKVT